MIAICKAQIS